MTTDISCRKATAADCDAIWRVRTASIRVLCKSYYDERATESWASVPVPDDFVDVIHWREFIVAEHGDDIVGFGFLNQHTGELEAIFVEPQCARCGVGTKILTSLEAAAKRKGLRRIFLSASMNSVSFYESAGYRAIEQTTWHHPAGFSLPCVAMAKEL